MRIFPKIPAVTFYIANQQFLRKCFKQADSPTDKQPYRRMYGGETTPLPLNGDLKKVRGM